MESIFDESRCEAVLLMVGDIILDEPDPASYFDYCRESLRTGDIVIGHVEVPHTLRGSEQSTDVPAPPADPANLAALKEAGFNVATLAGNHISDCGREGIEDTVATLQRLGIQTTGAGMNLTAAREPVLIERRNIKVGVLSYNCVGPREGWATSKKAGCAYIQILTHFEMDQATPGSPPSIFTFIHPQSMEMMEGDIRQLRDKCDILVVALHKGVGHIREHVDMYEYSVSHAAIDAGADIVIGHHAHIMRGIEIYRGKPIYHGLGNFVTVTHALASSGNDSPERQAWAIKREKMFGFKPDPDMPFYPFHPDSRNTIIAKCAVNKDGVLQAGFIPCHMDRKARPHVMKKYENCREVADYVEHISMAAGMETRFVCKDGEVFVE